MLYLCQIKIHTTKQFTQIITQWIHVSFLQIIDGYLGLLQYDGNKGIACFPSCFYTSLTLFGFDDCLKYTQYDDNILFRNKIFIPLNIENIHWALMVCI